MTEILWALGGLVVGAVIAFLAARLTSSAAAERLAEKRADERERRVRDEAERRIADLKDQYAQMQSQFKALSADVLQASQKQFLEIAEQRFARTSEAQQAELAKREASVKQLIEPMAKALDDVKRQTSEADKARAATQAALSEQLLRLGKETAGLKTALRRPEVRGRWGELHLQRVVEVAGLVNYVDFVEQQTGTDDDGNRLRPDMLVQLAGGRTIVVDAKTPIDALFDATETDDPDVRDRHLDHHVENVRKRVTELKSKQYTAQFDSALEFVILFLPAESFLQAALERDPRLQEWAYEQGVVIATPTILVALLRTVGHAWKQDALAKNAQEVLTTGRELYERLMKMGEHFAKVGKAIDSAGKAYNDTVGALERRVLPSARKMGRLQQIDADVATSQTETEIRELTAPELSGDDK